MEIEFDFKGPKARDVEKALRDSIAGILDDVSLAYLQRVRRSMIEKESVASKTMIESLSRRAVGPDEVEVGDTALQSIWMEQGRNAGPLPLRVIVEWVRLKRLPYDPYLVWKKVYNEGYEPRWHFRDAIKSEDERVKRILDNAAREFNDKFQET